MFNEVLTEAHDVSFLVGYIKLDCNLGKIIAANSALSLDLLEEPVKAMKVPMISQST